MSDKLRGPPFRLIPFLCLAILAISDPSAEIKQATEEDALGPLDFDTDSVVKNIGLLLFLTQRGTASGETTHSLMADLNFSDRIDYEDILLLTYEWRQHAEPPPQVTPTKFLAFQGISEFLVKRFPSGQDRNLSCLFIQNGI